MKIKVYIPGFGERYCSDNVKYEMYDDEYTYYAFFKKKTNILHNEYGPAYELGSGYCQYFINNKKHRLLYETIKDINLSYIIGEFAGYTKKDFINNLADILIPKAKKI